MTQPEPPLVLAGPILRRLTPQRLTFWLATREPVRLRLTLGDDTTPSQTLERAPGETGYRCLRAARRLHYALIDLALDQALPGDRWIPYQLALQPLNDDQARWQDWRDWAPDLCYPGKSSPGFVLPTRVGALLHGSCRKPHHPGGDGLARADQLLAHCLADEPLANGDTTEPLPTWPSVLIMTGDQIYADDVAGPMLVATHALIKQLEFPVEALVGVDESDMADAEALYRHSACYYARQTLLPRQKRNHALVEVVFGGVEKPVFTTASARNHLITIAEILAMYLLVWSPTPWRHISYDAPTSLDAESRELYAKERKAIDAFVADLPQVRRLFAHLPIAMIFDDHDVTDDWNLSREWEEVAYGHPFSHRMIGNALIGYLINQGWGNRPEAFDDALLDCVQQSLDEPGQEIHGDCIEQLMHFDRWHYTWPTEPPLVVIDTRTHRWRSEIAARRPSGLMDWERLTDLQQQLRNLPAVLLVSAAPMFGVKLIEAIQRLFTWFGHPLMVDAENWMAHRGAAHTMLNIFRHRETPDNFVILSGDVHYSFVYDVELRGHTRGPNIWQICSSGVRNEFPDRLLRVLDHLNRWLYSPRSPLNWFTRRRRMRVIPRRPEGTPAGRRLLNGTGIGLVELDADGVPWRIRELLTDGHVYAFTRREKESHWD